MPHILHIRSSSNLNTSTSRKLGSDVIKRLQELYPNITTTVRDLAIHSLFPLTADVLEQMMSSDKESAFHQTSNALINELIESDILVIEAPMYNYTVPATLKTWFDYILIARKTFKYTENGVQGLVDNKRVFLTLARGGVYSTPEQAAFEYQEKYLHTVLSHIGITNIETIIAEGLSMGQEIADEAVRNAQQKINTISFSDTK
jgi:FMN-dependent NADH-azoreductase